VFTGHVHQQRFQDHRKQVYYTEADRSGSVSYMSIHDGFREIA